MSQPKIEVDPYGTKHWYLNGKRHREDGPAIEHFDGSKHWTLNGEYHREDGPAIEYPDETKWWYLNGKSHREDGPAIEYPKGTKKWFLNGELVSWKEVFRNAKGDLEKECRILTYALTDGVVNVAT
jgi:hypothetical protein